MRQYNKLLRPIAEYGNGSTVMSEPISGPIIVATKEELRDMCIAIVKEWVEETSDGSVIEEEVSEDLDKYLKNKGITIP